MMAFRAIAILGATVVLVSTRLLCFAMQSYAALALVGNPRQHWRLLLSTLLCTRVRTPAKQALFALKIRRP